MLLLVIFIVLLVLVLHLILPYRWMSADFYKHLSRIPGPKGYPIIGSSLMFVNTPPEEIYNVMSKFAVEYGPIGKVNGFGFAHVFVSDPEFVEIILTNTANITKSFDYMLLKPWLEDGLLLSTGDKWRSRRKLLTPAFHFKILEDYIPIFYKNSKILVNKIWEHIDEPFVELNKLITLCTLDIICEATMGVSIHAQDGEEVNYVKAVNRMSQLFQKRQLNPLIYKDIVFNLSSIGREQRQVLKVLHDFTNKVIHQRRQEYISQRDEAGNDQQRKKHTLAFLDLLIEISETQQLLTDEDIREEVDTFMFEGHDTTSASLNWAMFLLGSHPDIQDEVIKELDSIFGDSDRDPTYSDLSQMKFLEQVIKETLRLYPSVPVIARQVEKEIHINDYIIPVGANATILTAVLHRNPEHYPEPEKFDPSRFSPEACQKRHPFAYVPFSAGSRSCIGQRFALMEEKIVLSTVLRNFKIESLDRLEDVSVTMQIVLRPKKPFRMRFIPRK